MSVESETVQGSCFCGAVTFEIALPTVFCGHCHCSMCRRPHGASYVTWVGVVPAQFNITCGESELKTYNSSAHGRRQFCSHCGSQLFCWHIKEDGSPPDIIDVTRASLHGEIDRAPQAHFFYDSKANWTLIEDILPKLGGVDGVQPLA